MIPDPYKSIVNKRYVQFLQKEINDTNLKKYFDSCFEDVFSYYSLYPCWICVKCMENEKLSYGWGEKPQICPKCSKHSLYAIGTFQAWASKSGDAFEWAFYKLIKENSDLPIVHKSTVTHDFKITDNIAVEAKGSAECIKNPDGTKYVLGRPGMKRSDTEKKAFANAEKYKNQRPSDKFFIVTNASPAGLTAKGRAADGVFELTKKKELQNFIVECNEFVKKRKLKLF